MQPVTDDPRSFLLQRIRDDLRKADGAAARLRRTNARLVVGSLAAGALGTLLAGLAAATGPIAGEGVTAWRWTCGAVAVVTALSGLLTGAHQRFQVPERLARLLACAGRLRALELALGLSGRDTAEVAREYEELVALHPELGA